MQVTFANAGFVVEDDCLALPDLARLRQEVAHNRFRSVHSEGWDKSWRLWDGGPLRGEGLYFDPAGRIGGRIARYPSGTMLDLVVDWVRDAAARHPHIAGFEGQAWDALYLTPWIYPPGSALSPHRDDRDYAGSFTFFVHAQWSPLWGGELFVMSAGKRPQGPPEEGRVPWLSGDVEHEGTGIDHAVLPRPNRLVLLGPDQLHRVGRVDPNAGNHPRLSVAGFFLRPPRQP